MKSFTGISSLKRHMLTHTGQKSYVSKLCNKEFTQAGDGKAICWYILVRNLIHVKLVRKCLGALPTSRDIRWSILEIHNIYMKCLLRVHLLIHYWNKRFVYDICKKQFRCRSHLKKHKLIHTGYKSCCKICAEKEFAESNDLKRHILIHTCQKLHICSMCHKQLAPI